MEVKVGKKRPKKNPQRLTTKKFDCNIMLVNEGLGMK
jgi:hypothetical protein